jgi:hypothetical protein
MYSDPGGPKHTDMGPLHCLQVFLSRTAPKVLPRVTDESGMAQCWIKRTCPLITYPRFSLLLLRPYLGWQKSLAWPQCWIKRTCPVVTFPGFSLLPLPRVTEESDMFSLLDKSDMSCRQCCTSVTFWYGSRSGNLYLRQTDPDPAIFVSDLQGWQLKKKIFPPFLFYF